MGITVTFPTPTPRPFIQQLFSGYVFPVIILAVVLGAVGFCLYYFLIRKYLAQAKKVPHQYLGVEGKIETNVYTVWFFERRKAGTQDRYFKLGSETEIVDKDKQNFSFDDRQWSFDKTKPLIVSDKANVYAFDFQSQAQLCFSGELKMPKTVSIKDVDNYVNQGIIEKCISHLEIDENKHKLQWQWLLVGALIGVGVGFIIGQIAYTHGWVKLVLTLL